MLRKAGPASAVPGAARTRASQAASVDGRNTSLRGCALGYDRYRYFLHGSFDRLVIGIGPIGTEHSGPRLHGQIELEQISISAKADELLGRRHQHRIAHRFQVELKPAI